MKTAAEKKMRDEQLPSVPFSDQADALLKTARRYEARGRLHWPSIERIYRWLLMCGFEHPVIHYNFARNLHFHGKYEEAVKHYKKAAELNPDDYKAWNNLGIVLAELGRYKESETAYKEALSLKLCARHYCNLADLYLRQSRLDEAEAEVQIALNMEPDCFDALHTYAQILVKMGRIEEAEVKFTTALSLNNDDLELLREFGDFLIRRGKVKEGNDLLHKVRTISGVIESKSRQLEQWKRESQYSSDR